MNTKRNDLLYVLAITLLAYPLAKLLVLPAVILDGLHLWIHEFGHSTIAWLGGIAATPLPFGWSNMGSDRSLFVHVSFVFLLSLMAVRSFQSENYYWLFTSIVLLAFKFYFSFGLSLERLQIVAIWGGVGGEFFFATFLWMAAHHQFTKDAYWPILRTSLMVAGTYSLFAASRMWISISKGNEELPLGSLFFGEGDSGGDMNQLLDMAGWTKLEIVQSYLKIMRICWSVIALHLIIQFFLYLVKSESPAKTKKPPHRRIG